MAKIFIVDDHPVSQLAVKVMATSNGHEVIGTCNNGRDALKELKQCHPDLVVIDIDIPPPNGLDVIKRLRAENFPGGILVLSVHSEQHFIDRARSAGANGYISKNNDLDQLVDAFKAIHSGYEFFPRRASAEHSPAPPRRSLRRWRLAHYQTANWKCWAIWPEGRCWSRLQRSCTSAISR